MILTRIEQVQADLPATRMANGINGDNGHMLWRYLDDLSTYAETESEMDHDLHEDTKHTEANFTPSLPPGMDLSLDEASTILASPTINQFSHEIPISSVLPLRRPSRVSTRSPLAKLEVTLSSTHEQHEQRLKKEKHEQRLKKEKSRQKLKALEDLFEQGKAQSAQQLNHTFNSQAYGARRHSSAFQETTTGSSPDKENVPTTPCEKRFSTCDIKSQSQSRRSLGPLHLSKSLGNIMESGSKVSQLLESPNSTKASPLPLRTVTKRGVPDSEVSRRATATSVPISGRPPADRGCHRKDHNTQGTLSRKREKRTFDESQGRPISNISTADVEKNSLHFQFARHGGVKSKSQSDLWQQSRSTSRNSQVHHQSNRLSQPTCQRLANSRSMMDIQSRMDPRIYDTNTQFTVFLHYPEAYPQSKSTALSTNTVDQPNPLPLSSFLSKPELKSYNSKPKEPFNLDMHLGYHGASGKAKKVIDYFRGRGKYSSKEVMLKRKLSRMSLLSVSSPIS
jgi:hypothetical protein